MTRRIGVRAGLRPRFSHSAADVLASPGASHILLVASGSFDGLAHEPRRHGVQPACVVSLDAPAGLEASIIRHDHLSCGTAMRLTNVELWLWSADQWRRVASHGRCKQLGTQAPVGSYAAAVTVSATTSSLPL
jgi:hypothetical protein